MPQATRRNFLKALVTATGAAVVAPHLLPKALPAVPAEQLGGVVQKAQSFIPTSIELLKDDPNWQAEFNRLHRHQAEALDREFWLSATTDS